MAKLKINVPCQRKGDKAPRLVEVEGTVMRYKIGTETHRFLIHEAPDKSGMVLSHIASGQRAFRLDPPYTRLRNPWKPREVATYKLDAAVRSLGADEMNRRLNDAPVVNT